MPMPKGLVQSDNHESTIIPAMNTGKHAFTIVYTYVLAALNDAATQPLAGQFALAPMPGETHATLGFAKSYVITAKTAADPKRAEAAWKFVNFMAGKPYTVAKRWAVEKGLGFGQLPLFKDQDVIAAWGKWADVGALGQAGLDRQGRHLHRILLGLVRVLPAAAGKGDGGRSAGRSGHEGRRAALDRVEGAVREPVDSLRNAGGR